MAHGIIGVSGAKAWSICPAKERLESAFKNESGKAAKIGHALHYALSGGMDGQPRYAADSEARMPYPGYLGTNNIAARNLALIDDLTLFNDLAREALIELGENPNDWIESFKTMRGHFRWALEYAPGHVHIEAPVPVGRAFKMPNPDDFWGSADLIITPLNKFEPLLILDYKTGRHPVNPERNYQMKLYALGVLALSKSIGLNLDDVDEIVLAISQPPAQNGGGVWHTRKKDLIEWRDSFLPKVLRMLDRNSQPRASEFSCKWCRAKSTCPEFKGNKFDQLEAMLKEKFD